MKNEERIELYKQLLKTSTGEKFLEELKEYVGYGEPSFSMGVDDKMYSVAFLEGQKHIVNRMIKLMNTKLVEAPKQDKEI